MKNNVINDLSKKKCMTIANIRESFIEKQMKKLKRMEKTFHLGLELTIIGHKPL
jgi:hypothetical protein